MSTTADPDVPQKSIVEAGNGPNSIERAVVEKLCEVRLCHYCGALADTVDHLRPRSSVAHGAQLLIPTVPACRDCNCRILNDLPLYNEVDRGRHVASVLGGRMLRMGPPKWTEADAKAELRGNLRRKIVNYIKRYELLKDRSEWATAKWCAE